MGRGGRVVSEVGGSLRPPRLPQTWKATAQELAGQVRADLRDGQLLFGD